MPYRFASSRRGFTAQGYTDALKARQEDIGNYLDRVVERLRREAEFAEDLSIDAGEGGYAYYQDVWKQFAEQLDFIAKAIEDELGGRPHRYKPGHRR